jgi:hypothetical protein
MRRGLGMEIWRKVKVIIFNIQLSMINIQVGEGTLEQGILEQGTTEQVRCTGSNLDREQSNRMK